MVTGRRITTALTLVVLLMLLAGMAIVGFNKLTEPLPDNPTAQPTCSDAEQEVREFVRRSEVQVSVFNAGRREGLAGTTLEKLEEGGFRAGNAGNAPPKAKVSRAVVWTTKPNDSTAKLVALAFGKQTKVVVTETDLGPGIDVLVGNKFKRLDPKAPRRIKLPAPVETCIRVD